MIAEDSRFRDLPVGLIGKPMGVDARMLPHLVFASEPQCLVSRVLPQMNMFVIGVPVKIVATIAVLMLTLASLGPAMGRVYSGIFTYWERVLG